MATEPASPRLIAHLDMDAFYASVELLRYPELRGRAVVIGGGSRHQPHEHVDVATGQTIRTFATLRDYAGRGVATTATYEARALGVHSAMALMKAASLAPDAVLLPVDFDAYRKYSRLFKAAVRTIATEIEDRGIDEIYIDLTNVEPPSDAHRARESNEDEMRDPWRRAQRAAKAIKSAVRAATGLTCSLAIAPNKLLAKIASDLDKPDGLTVLTEADVSARIWPLPARRINGIGPKTAAKLEAFGIRTIGELARTDGGWLVEQFGEHMGVWLHDAANGRDTSPVITHSEPRSISRELTFDRDLDAKRDREELSRIFTGLCEGVAGDLQRKGYVGRTIGLKLRFANFRTVTRDQTLTVPTNDPQTIRRVAGECLKRIDLVRRIRLLGVRVGTLSAVDAAAVPPEPRVEEPAPSLFDDRGAVE
jgi:DNA polymerase IV